MRRLGYTPAWILDSRITDLVFMVRHAMPVRVHSILWAPLALPVALPVGA